MRQDYVSIDSADRNVTNTEECVKPPVASVLSGILKYNNEPPADDEQPVYAPAKADIRGKAARKGRKAKPAVEEVEEDDLTEMLDTEDEAD